MENPPVFQVVHGSQVLPVKEEINEKCTVKYVHIDILYNYANTVYSTLIWIL